MRSLVSGVLEQELHYFRMVSAFGIIARLFPSASKP